MYKEIKYSDFSKDILEQLQKSAFLTVKHGDDINTMIIGWGSLGYIWRKPVFMAMVRYSRHTYNLIDKAEDFSVSFPLKGQLKEAIALCGTKSGRDIDKIKECNLTLIAGETINSPIIDECDLHLECKIIYKQEMDQNTLLPEIKQSAYSKGDYHVLYYGEITKAYIKE